MPPSVSPTCRTYSEADGIAVTPASPLSDVPLFVGFAALLPLDAGQAALTSN
jgi:hypothetical protein